MSELEKRVKEWMRIHASEYDCATSLAEGANVVFDGISPWLDDDTHAIWDWAIEFTTDKWVPVA